MRRLLHSTVKIRVETLLASWIFGRGPRYHQRAHQPVPARLQSDCGGSPSPVIGLAAIAADARVIPTGRNSDPCVMAGLGPATHDFCSCHQQSRGWPACACPRALDPWAGRDTSESASTRDRISRLGLASPRRRPAGLQPSTTPASRRNASSGSSGRPRMVAWSPSTRSNNCTPGPSSR